MPPQGKAAQRARETNGSSATVLPPASASASQQAPPRTVDERSRERYFQGRAYEQVVETKGISGLSASDRTAWVSAQLLGGASASSPAQGGRHLLSNKAQKELWRHVNEASLPIRALRRPPALPPQQQQQQGGPSGGGGGDGSSCGLWGRDRTGRSIGSYTPAELSERTEKCVRLAALEIGHCAFEAKREAGEAAPQDLEEERQRRVDMAALRTALYGQRAVGSYAKDPEWDDVLPIPLDEPEGALAAIAYPEAYSEAISYLRAVMSKPEYSKRCLQLTEHVISLNPAHYTVWLYRFSIVHALQVPVPDEIAWLNEVAMQNLKNYQIWHHRFLLAEHYYPQIAGAPERVAAFARSEMAFLTTILAEDTKNYHVWSYRQYLVRKLGYWTDDERYSTEAFIRQDVRNNSAWSHRFFLVFSDPSHSSAGGGAKGAEDGQRPQADKADKAESLESALGELNVGPDPAVPAAILDREVAYAQEQILKAPQNESPWNYLRGVLVKGSRPLASMEAFVRQFVAGMGGGGGDESAEVVKSTHAVDFLASICEEKGDQAQAVVLLQRLADKWDPIRAGYWKYRQQQLA